MNFNLLIVVIKRIFSGRVPNSVYYNGSKRFKFLERSKFFVLGSNEVVSFRFVRYVIKRYSLYVARKAKLKKQKILRDAILKATETNSPLIWGFAGKKGVQKRKRKPFLEVENYFFRHSILGFRFEFGGRFSRAQRKYFSSHQRGRVPFNSFIIPIRFFCLPVTLKFGVSTIKVWVAYSPAFILLNYSFKRLKFRYVCYSFSFFYFASNAWFSKAFMVNYLKNRKVKFS